MANVEILLDELRREIHKARLDYEKVVSELESLKTTLELVTREEQVDVVRVGPFVNFMFKGDLAYDLLPESVKHQAGLLLRTSERAVEQGDLQDLDHFLRAWRPEDPIRNRLLAQYMKYLPDFAVVDIGCQYGSSAMSMARFLRSFGHENRVFAFDPGDAGKLTPLNIVNNHFENMIEFYPFAVGNHDGYTLLFGELGHSENNRIVNEGRRAATFSRPVKCVRLDSFIESQNYQGPLFVKIDTQGAEHEVFQGMERLLGRECISGIAEFTPHALHSRIAPGQFLQNLVARHHLFELRERDRLGERVEKGDIERFVKRVSTSERKWTDLVFVDSRLPGLPEILESFGSKVPEQMKF